MKTIGLLGGMSWESTATYYRLLNQTMRERLGGFHSARIVLHSVEFDEFHRLQHRGEWDLIGERLGTAARALERAGAQCLVLCTNTMHKVAPAIASAVTIPMLHIADATAVAIKAAGLDTVGLLGTRFTMEQDFYVARLRDHGLRVLVPDVPARETVHRVIYDELCQGTIRDDSRARYRDIMAALADRGARGIILGCTEIGLLVGPADAPVPLFDTTQLHARAAVDWALAQ